MHLPSCGSDGGEETPNAKLFCTTSWWNGRLTASRYDWSAEKPESDHVRPEYSQRSAGWLWKAWRARKEHRWKGFWERFNHEGLPEVEQLRIVSVEAAFPPRTCDRSSQQHRANSLPLLPVESSSACGRRSSFLPFLHKWAEKKKKS